MDRIQNPLSWQSIIIDVQFIVFKDIGSFAESHDLWEMMVVERKEGGCTHQFLLVPVHDLG